MGRCTFLKQMKDFIKEVLFWIFLSFCMDSSHKLIIYSSIYLLESRDVF